MPENSRKCPNLMRISGLMRISDLMRISGLMRISDLMHSNGLSCPPSSAVRSAEAAGSENYRWLLAAISCRKRRRFRKRQDFSEKFAELFR